MSKSERELEVRRIQLIVQAHLEEAIRPFHDKAVTPLVLQQVRSAILESLTHMHKEGLIPLVPAFSVKKSKKANTFAITWEEQ